MPRATIKDSRLSIRIDPAQKAVIAKAAKQQGTTVSEFVAGRAYDVAKTLMADEGHLGLTKKQVAHIFETLDNPPPKSLAAMRKLLTEPSVLDR